MTEILLKLHKTPCNQSVSYAFRKKPIENTFGEGENAGNHKVFHIIEEKSRQFEPSLVF